jgi:hypothetical protein
VHATSDIRSGLEGETIFRVRDALPASGDFFALRLLEIKIKIKVVILWSDGGDRNPRLRYQSLKLGFDLGELLASAAP